MNRFDRILGIVLRLRSNERLSASQLAAQFAVSRRTIYRDIETLSLLGVPVYSERGRDGGIRLLEGYFLPTLMFSTKEAISLLLGLAFLQRIKHKPFAAELGSAEQKLLAALPERLQIVLQNARQLIGFEEVPDDIFHPEPGDGQTNSRLQNPILTHFLQAILDDKFIQLQYQSPYDHEARWIEATPMGMFWDRNRWYLVGQEDGQPNAPRLWRADRVVQLRLGGERGEKRPFFDIQSLLNHNWLETAMRAWQQEAPVKIQLTPAQAERLQQDWYYRHAQFELSSNGQTIMTFGEDNQEAVLALVRWLGKDAILLEPKAWQQQLQQELRHMLAAYEQHLQQT